MKRSISQFALAAAAGAAALLGSAAATTAHAAIVTPGAACKPFGQPSSAALQAISSTQSGIANLDPGISRSVICPLPRVTSGDGISVYIEGTVNYNRSLSCIVYSYNYNGQLMASKSFVAPNQNTTNVFDGHVSFTAGEAPYWSMISAVCSLPALNSGRIFGLSVTD